MVFDKQANAPQQQQPNISSYSCNLLRLCFISLYGKYFLGKFLDFKTHFVPNSISHISDKIQCLKVNSKFAFYNISSEASFCLKYKRRSSLRSQKWDCFVVFKHFEKMEIHASFDCVNDALVFWWKRNKSHHGGNFKEKLDLGTAQSSIPVCLWFHAQWTLGAVARLRDSHWTHERFGSSKKIVDAMQ